MITYRHDGLAPFKITVLLEGKIAGHIRKDKAGRYEYKPRGSARAGASCATVEQVKRWLES